MKKDPVCLMDVDENTGLKAEYKGKNYYFCANSCLEKFLRKPGNYLARHGDLLDNDQ